MGKHLSPHQEAQLEEACDQAVALMLKALSQSLQKVVAAALKASEPEDAPPGKPQAVRRKRR